MPLSAHWAHCLLQQVKRCAVQAMSCCTRHTQAASSQMASMRGRQSSRAMSLSSKEVVQVCRPTDGDS